jgi:hypothetical protein
MMLFSSSDIFISIFYNYSKKMPEMVTFVAEQLQKAWQKKGILTNWRGT